MPATIERVTVVVGGYYRQRYYSARTVRFGEDLDLDAIETETRDFFEATHPPGDLGNYDTSHADETVPKYEWDHGPRRYFRGFAAQTAIRAVRGRRGGWALRKKYIDVGGYTPKTGPQAGVPKKGHRRRAWVRVWVKGVEAVEGRPGYGAEPAGYYGGRGPVIDYEDEGPTLHSEKVRKDGKDRSPGGIGAPV